MSTAPEPEHLPDRPHWRCRVCDQPWPCPESQASLLDEYRAYPSLLKIYLSAQMYEALDDFTAYGGVPPLNLYERFLSWARNRSASGDPSVTHHSPESRSPPCPSSDSPSSGPRSL
ncbi:hypothetical protein QLQ12_03255 [Actinoplanes sp. NEAU-A12]|uniref:Flavin reductase n=1 Tax=Actinoplanes sandaracinus TaxID=3045177 RepID=A0ABT6WD09_9ACTN|nr:hypothetical protein [Actinoplanes sandaracinus]MDI6097618.1 hypothetical protein [Actinoplanes sandaracinus]